MRFVVYGAGAVGGVLGAGLFEAGEDVVLVARGAHHDAIRDRGLTVETPDRTVTLAVPVVDHPARAGLRDGDAVLLVMKSQDTPDALDALAGCMPPAVPVVCVQNGVVNERLAAARFPDVYGVCVMTPAAHLEPGVVQAFSAPVPGLLDVGRYPSGAGETAERLAAGFRAATFDSLVRDDIMRWKHTKLLMNLGNALEAVCEPSPETADIATMLRAEGVACLRAAGIDFASEEEDAQRRGNLVRLRPIGGQRRGGGSTWQSLARGTGSVEVDAFNGEIVRLGELHGVPTPANAVLLRAAHDLARSARPPGSVPAAELLRAIDAERAA